MNFLYNTGIACYRAAVRLARIKSPKARLMLQGHKLAFHQLRQKLDPSIAYIWIHASSLGEFEQARPLIEKLRQERPQEHIVLSFFSPSGFEIRKNYDKVDCVCYLPFDTPANAREFVELLHPKMAIFVKYEFWGNYLDELRKREVPTYLISSIFRPGQIFFRPWGGMFRHMLQCFKHIYVQNQESQQLLQSIGITDVTVAGDTRFDRVAGVLARAKQFPIVEAMTKGSQFTLVMGSSWQPDEDIVIPYFNAHPEMKLVIAPHEFDKHRLTVLLGRIRRPVALYTHTTEAQAAKLDCLVIDCFGILSSLYRYGQMAYIGGGFGAGIHNINEAAVFGIPVVFGPKHGKFQEASDLIGNGGGFSISNAQEFEAVANRMLTQPKALTQAGDTAASYIQSHLGATDRICADLF